MSPAQYYVYGDDAVGQYIKLHVRGEDKYFQLQTSDQGSAYITLSNLKNATWPRGGSLRLRTSDNTDVLWRNGTPLLESQCRLYACTEPRRCTWVPVTLEQAILGSPQAWSPQRALSGVRNEYIIPSGIHPVGRVHVEEYNLPSNFSAVKVGLIGSEARTEARPQTYTLDDGKHISLFQVSGGHMVVVEAQVVGSQGSISCFRTTVIVPIGTVARLYCPTRSEQRLV